MKSYKLSYKDTGKFGDLFLDYVNGDPYLDSYYSYKPSLSSFENAIKGRSAMDVDRQVLVSSLQDQYKNHAPELLTSVQASVDLLSSQDTFTITTGHQLNLLTGPLYSVYKIATVVKMANLLKQQYPQYNFVPVFWMATEDHDFQEISSVNIGASSAKWEPGLPPAACGELPLNQFDSFLESVKALSGDSDLFRELASCYLSSSNLAQATRRMVHYLFKDTSLVVIDGNDPALKSRFILEMLDDAFTGNPFKIVSETASGMGGKYDVQVNPREINLFYLENSNRGRIVKHPETGYEVIGSTKTFTSSSLENEIKEHPEHFSPNVIMRPLYQEKVLPNLAYIGGPGELAYWLELKALFNHYKIFFPVLMPRCSFMLADDSVVRKTAKLGLEIKDLFMGRDALIRKVVVAPDEMNSDFLKSRDQVSDAFDSLGSLVKEVDQTLLASLEGEKQKALKSVSLIEDKINRALKRKQEGTITQMDSLLAKLMPNGSLQERHQNILAVSGDRKFVDDIINACDPFSLTFDILYSDDQP